MAGKSFEYGFRIRGDNADGKAAIIETRTEVDKLERATKQATTQGAKWRKETKEQNRTLSDAKKLVAGFAGIAGIGLLVNKFKEVNTESELLKGQLVTMTGDVEKAGLAYDKLIKFAANTPFTLDQSVQGFVKLTALGLKPSERALESYGNTASAMGKDLNQMVEAVADAATMEFERLKEFGIKARQEADTVSFTFQGVTTTVAKNAADIQEFLTGIGENNFGDAMANQMVRLPGLLSNLEDNVDGLFRAMGDTGGLSAMESTVKGLSNSVIFITGGIEYLRTAFEQTFGIIDREYTKFSSNNRLLAMNLANIWGQVTTNISFMFKIILAEITGIWGDGIADLQRLFGALLVTFANGVESLPFTDGLADPVRAYADSLVIVANNAETMTEKLAGLRTERDRLLAKQKTDYIAADNAEREATAARVAQITELIQQVRTHALINEEITTSLEDLVKQNDRTTSSTVELSSAQQTLLDKLYPLQAETRTYNQELDELFNVYSQLGPAGQEYADAIEELKKQYPLLFPEIQAHIDAVKLQEKTYNNMIENIQKNLATMITEMKFSFKDLGDSITDMWKRIVAEMISSNVVQMLFGGKTASLGGLFEGPGGSSTGSMLTNILSAGGTLSGLAGGLGGVGTAVSGFAQGAAGFGQGAAGFMGPMTQAGTMGANFAAFLTSPAGIALGVAIAGKVIHDKTNNPDGYTRSNSGLLFGDTSGLKRQDRLFNVDNFDSGLAVTGFNRRTHREDATGVINQFREVDQIITALVQTAGGVIDLSNATLAGVNQDGQDNTAGNFLGKGGKTESLTGQLNLFAGQLVNHISGLTNEDLDALKAAGTVENVVDILSGIAIAHEESATELARITEETDKARIESAENTFTQLRNAAVQTVESLRASMAKLTAAIRSDILKAQGVAELFPGAGSSIDAQIAHLEELRQIALSNHAAEIAAEKELHSWRVNFAKGLRSFITSTQLGALSTLSGGDKLGVAQSAFEGILGRVNNTSLTSGERQDAGNELEGAAQNYLEAARSQFASSATYKQIFSDVTAQLETVAAVIIPAAATFDPSSANNRLVTELQRIQALLELLPAGIARELATIMQGVITAGLAAGKSPSFLANTAANLGPGAVAAANETFNTLGLGSVESLAFSAEQLRAGSQELLASSSSEAAAVLAAVEAAKASGVSLYRIGEANGFNREETEAYLSQFGVQAFANGGIVTKPTLGLLREAGVNEAVVPLPNGRSIPVDQGAMGGDIRALKESVDRLVGVSQTGAEIGVEQRNKTNQALGDIAERLDDIGAKRGAVA